MISLKIQITVGYRKRIRERDYSILENKFKDELILFTSEAILFIGPLLELLITLQYVHIVNIDEIVDQLTDLIRSACRLLIISEIKYRHGYIIPINQIM